jgi:acetyl esterase/lipase
MKIHTWLAAILILIFGGVAGAFIAGNSYQRADLPLPVGASEPIRDAIAEAGKLDVGARKLLAPTSVNLWRMLIKERAESQETSLEEISERLNVTITREVINSVPVHRVIANDKPVDNGLFIYIHGGAYVFGGGNRGVAEGALITSVSGLQTVSIDYRMPPDFPHPAAVNDVERVYRTLLTSHDAKNIGIGGTSAGGGLSLAAIHHFKALGLPLPNALYLGTPWADLTKTGDTLYTLEGIDRVLVTYDGVLAAAALLYADGVDLKDPLLSPIYGNFDNFPSTYLVTGTRDMFLSDTARVHRKLRIAGVKADLNVYEGLSHAEYVIVQETPEQVSMYKELAEFLLDNLK